MEIEENLQANANNNYQLDIKPVNLRLISNNFAGALHVNIKTNSLNDATLRLPSETKSTLIPAGMAIVLLSQAGNGAVEMISHPTIQSLRVRRSV